MNNNTKNWLNRVAIKLHKQFLLGMDFENYEHRWLFDWDDNLSTESNLENVIAEDAALIVLTQLGVIASTRQSNFYRAQQLESFDDPYRGHIVWGGWEDFDPPKREYEYLRFINNIDHEKLIEFCVENNINYEEKKTEATLDIVDQIPSVQVEGEKYYLKALKIGTAFDIIEAATTYFDKRLTLSKLRLIMKRPNALTAQKNLKQVFRANEFGEGNVLHPFAEIRTDAFILKQHASLTAQELSSIKKASTN